ncbi:MAG: hypothetical protein IPP40_06685 [bacterium]|nr:hypothetical protein [bacterium]
MALFLTTTSSAGSQIVRLNLTPVAANIAVNSTSFIIGDLQLDPGDSGPLTATIQNSGARVLTNASGILRSLSSHVTVTDSIGVFGAVAISGTAENLADAFAVSANINTVAGFAAQMELVITDTDGFRDSVEFVQIVGVASPTTPTGPDAYGYYAYDNTEIQPAGTATQYDWIDISTIGTNIGFSDVFEDDDDSQALLLPFDFTFYGNTFDSVTICSNGWVAFGNLGGFWDFRNWRIGSPMGPRQTWWRPIGMIWQQQAAEYIITTMLPSKDSLCNGMCKHFGRVFRKCSKSFCLIQHLIRLRRVTERYLCSIKM